MRKATVPAFLLAGFLASLPVCAETLTSAGADLGTVKAADLTKGLSVTVDLDKDGPTATHMIARFQNNQPLMRGADGLWAPWNGDTDALHDAGVTAEGGKLTFPIFETAPGQLFYPVIFTLAYRTEDGLKSGTITVVGP